MAVVVTSVAHERKRPHDEREEDEKYLHTEYHCLLLTYAPHNTTQYLAHSL